MWGRTYHDQASEQGGTFGGVNSLASKSRNQDDGGQEIFELKTQILQKIDKDMTMLETKLMIKMNEDRQTIAAHL